MNNTNKVKVFKSQDGGLVLPMRLYSSYPHVILGRPLIPIINYAPINPQMFGMSYMHINIRSVYGSVVIYFNLRSSDIHKLIPYMIRKVGLCENNNDQKLRFKIITPLDRQEIVVSEKTLICILESLNIKYDVA